MSSKHDTAVRIEHLLQDILGYEPYDESNRERSEKEKKRAIIDNVYADFFDCADDISHLQKAITRAIGTVNILKNEKQQLIDIVNELKTLPFEQVAEYWLLIAKLLYILKKK